MKAVWKLFIFIFVLIFLTAMQSMAFDKKEKDSKGLTNPQFVDESISGIFFHNSKSTKKVLGKDSWTKLYETKGDLPRMFRYNKDKSEILTLFFHHGGVKNEWAEFQVEKVKKKSGKIKVLKGIDHFISGKGIKLGMKIEQLKKILGEPNKKAENILSYRIEDIKLKKYKILVEHNLPIYYGKYHFDKGRLSKFRFGFEYP